MPPLLTQQQLHALIEALYAKQLRLDPVAAEPLLKAAHALGLSCVLTAGADYVARHFLPESPGEVSC